MGNSNVCTQTCLKCRGMKLHVWTQRTCSYVNIWMCSRTHMKHVLLNMQIFFKCHTCDRHGNVIFALKTETFAHVPVWKRKDVFRISAFKYLRTNRPLMYILLSWVLPKKFTTLFRVNLVVCCYNFSSLFLKDWMCWLSVTPKTILITFGVNQWRADSIFQHLLAIWLG